MSELTHIGDDNRPTMVDVGDKPQSIRTAIAKGMIFLNDETVQLISENALKKGNVLITAELAGVQAAKRTYELIPLCHTVMLTKVTVECTLCEDGVEAVAEARCIGQTGVEMEALTAVSVALLTIYDMCKAVDKKMIMSGILLVKKDKTSKELSTKHL